MPARLDPQLLRSFVAIADAGSLTRAGERLRLSQPTVSLQIKRLETALGCRLLERSPHAVRLTAKGETLLGYARRLLALSEEALAQLSAPSVAGIVRLGTPEDFATTHLPSVLAAFARAYPEVVLEVTTDLTLNLLQRFGDGEFDLVLVKREPAGPTDGVRVWREPLVWACAPPLADAFARSSEIRLVVSPHPCVYRRRAIRTLESIERGWRITYTSTSLAGAQAAVRAGLGVAVLPKEMVPPDFLVLDEAAGAPDLPDTEVALMVARPAAPQAERLAQHITHSLEQGGADRQRVRPAARPARQPTPAAPG